MDKKMLSAWLLVVVTFLAGCATTASVQGDYKVAASQKFTINLVAPGTLNAEAEGILRERLTSQLRSAGMLAAGAEPGAQVLEVNVTNYNMRHGAARALVGILAGTDNIQSTVRLKDKAGDRTVWEYKVESSNATAWGTSRGMIENHADEIVATLGKRKG